MHDPGSAYLQENIDDLSTGNQQNQPDYAHGLVTILTATTLVLYLVYWFLG